MATAVELSGAILRLQAEKPAEFATFEARYPDWESWTRGPYGAQREAVEMFLSEHDVLPKARVGGHTRQKKYSIVSYNIKLPLDSNLTLIGSSFFKAFGGTYYLFRRPGRLFGSPKPATESVFISKVEIRDQQSLNYTETRKGDGRGADFEQAGVAYLAEGSLVFLSSDELGHPWIASYARVSPRNIPRITPILDGHLLGSTYVPTSNGNFAVKVMLVKAPDRTEADTGLHKSDEAAHAQFQKLRPQGWDSDWWNHAFFERFKPNESNRLDGDYFQEFETHNKLEN